MNYKKLKSDKLQELLQTADEHEAIQIISVLKDRGVEPKMPAAAPAETKEAEKNGEAPAPAPAEKNGEAPAKETVEINDPEFVKRVEAAEANVGHKCQVVPFNTVDWVNGVIIGVTIDPKAKRVAYAIKTEEGKRMLKSTDSKLIKISEETVDLSTVTRQRSPRGNSAAGRTEEDLQKAIAEALPNVGKQLVVDENTTARIDGLLLDRRTMRVMYKYKIDGGQKFKSLSPDLVINDYANEADREHGENYANNFKAGTPVTKEERIAKIKASIERYESQVAKWKEELEKLEAPESTESAEA